MGYNITIKDENRICHVINNKQVFPELEPYPEYVRKLRKILKIGLNNSFDHSHSEMIHLASTKWIKTLHSLNYELAVVWFEGTIPKSNEFETELLKLHDGEWKDRRWLVAGHILNHEARGRYPYWHHQCIVINIRAYADAGFPNLNKYLEKRPAFKASEENFHDDYTPYYLKPMPDSRPELVETRHRFLDALIPNSLKLGYEVLNLPQQVRDHKECIYPEDDVEDTVKWLNDELRVTANANLQTCSALANKLTDPAATKQTWHSRTLLKEWGVERLYKTIGREWQNRPIEDIKRDLCQSLLRRIKHMRMHRRSERQASAGQQDETIIPGEDEAFIAELKKRKRC